MDLTKTDDSLCIGDYVSLYSGDAQGYVYAMMTSTAFAYLAVNSQESRDQPQCGDSQLLSFKVCAANRYKLQKEYKKLYHFYKDSDDKIQQVQLEQAKLSAESEARDNDVEQARQKGKKVLYGQVIQLQHDFTGKYVHISTQNTSPTEPSNMQVTLNPDDAGSALFKVMPRFKVKGEGDIVQFEDQVILESVKSPGQFLHVGRVRCREHIPVYEGSFELNLSVRYSGLTMVRRYTDHEKEAKNIRAGQLIRFFHTELEAYLVCEGSFNESPVEDVHLRIRAVEQTKPKTILKPSSAICYWQLEPVENVISGEIVKWKQQVRMRHMCTRKFLSLSPKGNLFLTVDRNDANTVFRLHQVLKEDGEIHDATYCRIQHAATKTWLHASKEDYIRKGLPSDPKGSNSMAGLVWSQAPLRKVEMAQKTQYDDAFTIYAVEPELVKIFNYVAGFVPLIQRFIFDHQNGSSRLDTVNTQQMVKALSELRDFIVIANIYNKNRTKLLRNLRIVDLLFRILQIPLTGGSTTSKHLLLIFEECYDLIYQYLYGESRKNELYCARYLDFLHHQRLQKEVNLNAARAFMAIVWDNRKIIDRIPRSYVEEYISLLQQSRCYEYLELLSVLCVCMDMSMPSNQNYITQKWLVDNQNSHLVYHTELGQKIGKQKDKVYVSMDNKKTWKLLAKMAQQYVAIVGPKDLENEMTSRQISHGQSNLANKKFFTHLDLNQETTSDVVRNFKFLKHQLDLFGKLCRGRNMRSIEVITKQLGYLTWEEAFLCLKDESLPGQLRAKYCELITTMFVDVDDNINVLDKIELVFVYEDVSGDFSNKMLQVYGKSATTRKYFPVLQDWIYSFFERNRRMVDSEETLNILLAEVLRMVHYLVKFGYFNTPFDIRKLLRPLLSMLDGRNDLPSRPDNYNNEREQQIDDANLKEFRATKRFECEHQETVLAKFEGMRVIDLFFNFQFNIRLDKFLAEFKNVQSNSQDKLALLLKQDYEHNEEVNAEACNRLSTMFSRCSYFNDLSSEAEPGVEIINSFNLFRRVSWHENEPVKDSGDMVNILLDISCYKSSKLVQMSMWLLNRYYSAYSLLFNRAVLSRLLFTEKSVSVHRMIERDSHVIRRMIGSKMTDADVETMCNILNKFCRVCHLEDDSEERHPMNQVIVYNSGILNDLFDLVSQHIEINERSEYSGLRRVYAKCFELLRLMARDNATVQNHMFERLETLLNCVGAERQLALALVEVFTGNKDTCMKVQPQQIARIMALVAQHGARGPEFLDLLNAMMKVEELDLPLKRNQECVMTYFLQHRNDIAQCLDQNQGAQLRLLRSSSRTAESDFMVALVDLLATCAEGENKSIESKNQSIYRLNEVLNILTDPGICSHNKRAYARFLQWVYLNTASGLIESGAGDLPHDASMWKLLGQARKELKVMAQLANENPRMVTQALKSNVSAKFTTEESLHEEWSMQRVHSTLKYLIEGMLPVISTFFKTVYLKDVETHPGEIEEVNQLTAATMDFVDAVLPLLTNKNYSRYLISAATSLVSVCSLPSKTNDAFKEKYLTGVQFKSKSISAAQERYQAYYSSEEELNKKLNIFAANFRTAYGGINTIQAQIGYAADREYTELGTDDELPLGKEFQQHMACFIDTNYAYSDPRRFAMMGKLVEQLCISNQLELHNEKERIEQEILDVKCLQLLRGAVHNEIVKLPENIDSEEYKKCCFRILHVQNAINSHDAMLKVLPNLVKPTDSIVREVLNFLATMLYNGNLDVQESMYEYFNSTREEKFFFTMHDRLTMSSNSLKENRALINQQRGKIDEKMLELRAQVELLEKDPEAAAEIQRTEQGAKLLSLLASKGRSGAAGGGGVAGHGHGPGTRGHSHRPLPGRKTTLFLDLAPDSMVKSTNRSNDQGNGSCNKDSPSSIAEQVSPNDKRRLNKADIEDLATQIVMDDENLQMKDDGHIELVLRVLAYICDGQNSHLQDYLREQPDNMKSYNLVSKTVEYLSLVYISVTRSNISLVIQLVETLVEFASGNLKNQIVCYDSKVCDYLNYLLRSQQLYTKCELEEELELKSAIANLIMALIEENIRVDKDSEAAGYARGMSENFNSYSRSKPNSVVVKDTIGPEIICQMFADLYERYEKFDSYRGGREDLLDVGFKFFHIFKRFQDLQPTKTLNIEDYLNFRESTAKRKEEIFRFYEDNTMSIEVLKDGNLQKVYFRVRDKKVLREEVKDLFKYEVDRSSPANKLRDFCDWLKEIINDIHWQKRVLGNPMGAFFVHGWKMFNMACIILSLAICCIVLATWKASKDKDNPIPVRPKPYGTLVLALGLAHNLFSLFVLISFFLCNKPYVPTRAKVYAYWCKVLSIETKASVAVLGEVEGNLQTSVFSFGTFYYIIFLAFSLLGTPLHGYFFAFHLLHIANHNQMLKRVFQAVTRNGLSLVWVMIYSLAIFYIYALICFAYYREIFDEEKGNFCNDMFQCTITVIRRGLIVGMYDEIEYFDVPRNHTFSYHLAKTVFDISFFIIITTIGLNIVFGIIVDTFSELRDAKWQIDKDMSSVCFICSKNSYDFEHYGEGFKKHIMEEHNIWAYLFFFLHLNETRFNDYTAIELYVWKLYSRDRLDFFPINRSLTLQAAEDAQDEAKIETLMSQVAFLVHRRKEEDAIKEREWQDAAQKRWEEQQKKAATRRLQQDVQPASTRRRAVVELLTSSSDDEQ